MAEFDLPPFPGFDETAMRLLRQLKRNNRREWFTAERKATYRDHLLEPMRCLLGELGVRFAAEGIPLHPNPTGGIFRIYRDIRFSTDTRPFKTHIGAAIPFADEGKKGVGTYVHIEPGGCFLAGGAWFIESAGLRNLRAAIDRRSDEFREIVVRLQRDVGPLEGAQLKRAPAGFSEDHPAIDLLRYKQMVTVRHFDDALATSRELVDWIVDVSRNMVDFNRFLHESIRGISTP